MPSSVKIKIFFAILLCTFLPLFFVLASTTDGTIDSTYKYAWGEDIGWVNFGCDNCNVHVTSSAVTGNAWSDNYGWINLNPTNGGVVNDGNGNLSGLAWGENIGWVDFTGVAINSSGQFTGEAVVQNTDGIINFNCDNCEVLTDWRVATSESGGNIIANGGGGGSLVLGMRAPPEGFKVVINNGSLATNNPIVTLTLDGGSTATTMDISNFSDLKDGLNFSYSSSQAWTLTQGDGTKNVYVRFHDDKGNASPVVSASIILDTSAPNIKVDALKSSYQTSEQIIVSGQTDANSSLIFSWDDKYGASQADNNGKWKVNLDDMAEGKHTLKITATNLLGNSKNISVDILVRFPLIIPPIYQNNPPAPASNGNSPTASSPQLNNSSIFYSNDKGSILENMEQKVLSFFGKVEVQIQQPPPPPIVTVPKKTPPVLSGKWNLLQINPQNIKK